MLGHLPVIIEYMLGIEPAPSAAQLTEMLGRAGILKRPSVAKVLRQHGAEWLAELKCHGGPWHADMVQWARDEGCTSPV
jgi:hypothetical protein